MKASFIRIFRLSSIILILMCILNPFGLFSQNFNNSNLIKKSPDYNSAQKNFSEWAKTTNLKKTKGWKQFARWSWMTEGRIFADGTIPGENYYYDAIQSRNEKANSDHALAQSAWVPIGPMNLPYCSEENSGIGIGRINCLAYHPTNPEIMWIGTPHGGIWKTNNNGISWTPLGDNLPSMKISGISVDPKNPNIMYISSGDYAYIYLKTLNRVRYNCFGMGVFKSVDGGQTWNPTGIVRYIKDLEYSIMLDVAIHPDSTQNLVAAGSTGIWKSSDAGTNWRKTFSGLVWDMKKHPVNKNELLITSGFVRHLPGSDTAAIYKSTDFGETWTMLNSGIPKRDSVTRIEVEYSIKDPNYIYAVTVNPYEAFYGLYRSTNGGVNWTTQCTYENTQNIMGWAYGDSTDGGGQGNYNLTLLISPDNTDEIYVGGINQWGSSDAGKSWNLITTWMYNNGKSIHADQQYAGYNPLNKTYYFANDGGIYRTKKVLIGSNQMLQDSSLSKTYKLPTEWENISNGLAITEFYRFGLSQNNQNYLFAGAQDVGFFYNKANHWSTIPIIGTISDGMETLIDHNDPSIVYGASYYGFLFKSVDRGPTFVEKSITDSIIYRSDESSVWVTPFIMDEKDSKTIFGGFSNVWKTTDGGSKWKRISSFDSIAGKSYALPIFAMAVNQKNTDNIYIYKRLYPALNQVGQMWKTSDGGTNWINISAGLPLDSVYVNYIAMDRDNPNLAWVVLSHFYEGVKVFKTTDAGSTWKNISMNLPNLPVNAIVHQDGSANHIIYIGTDCGIYYTHDNMNEWKLYNQNMPNVIVTKLAIQESNKKIFASTFGRGIWMNDLIPSKPTAIDNQTNHNELFTLYVNPNPNNGKFQIEINPINNEKILLQIIDITGKILYEESIENSGSSIRKNIDIKLISGLYFCKISDKRQNRVKKFVVE